jgi:hypothetical protein
MLIGTNKEPSSQHSIVGVETKTKIYDEDELCLPTPSPNSVILTSQEVDTESGKPIFTSDAHAYFQRWYFVILR